MFIAGLHQRGTSGKWSLFVNKKENKKSAGFSERFEKRCEVSSYFILNNLNIISFIKMTCRVCALTVSIDCVNIFVGTEPVSDMITTLCGLKVNLIIFITMLIKRNIN